MLILSEICTRADNKQWTKYYMEGTHTTNCCSLEYIRCNHRLRCLRPDPLRTPVKTNYEIINHTTTDELVYVVGFNLVPVNTWHEGFKTGVTQIYDRSRLSQRSNGTYKPTYSDYPKLRRVYKFINYLQFNTASLETAAVMGRDMFIVSLEMIKPKPVAYVKFEQLRYHTRRLDGL